MSYAVRHLIEGRDLPVSIKQEDSVKHALELMWQHDYSQLPVVDEDNRPIGMITHQSILRAQRHVGPCLDDLRVSSAMRKAQIFRPDEDVFDLLDGLKDENALLIVNGDGKLIGIVTSYDSTEYFRRRSEDMMRVRDVETMVKDLIRAAFSESSGQPDEFKLSAAVAAVTGHRGQLQGRYVNAVRHFMMLKDREDPHLDQKAIDESFAILAPMEKPRLFERLSLQEYIDLLLDRDRQDFYRQIMDLDPKQARSLLDGVRETRNMLAHFRDEEITPAQREQLQYCNEWLNRTLERLRRHPEPVLDGLSAVAESRAQYGIGTGRGEGATDQITKREAARIGPGDEALGPNDSRYAPLALWLQGQPRSEDRVQVSFEQIEGIIDSKLPRSARLRREWWANDSTSHVQSQEWLDAGWRASYINLTEEQVVFARIRERESAYIAFFGALLIKLRKGAPFRIKEISPDGQCWITIASLPALGPKVAHFSFSFARGKRFRIELYIDTGDQSQNKAIFDELLNGKNEIETKAGAILAFERLDGRRASRIAVYHNGEISDSEIKLVELQDWAVDTMIRFNAASRGPAHDAIRHKLSKS
jgi:CBS domain-containing protein